MDHARNAHISQQRAKQFRDNLHAQLVMSDFKMSDLAKKLDATAREKTDLEQALVTAQQDLATEKKDRETEKATLEQALVDEKNSHNSTAGEKTALEQDLVNARKDLATEKKNRETEKATLVQQIVDLQAIADENVKTLKLVDKLQDMLKKAHKEIGSLEEKLRNANTTSQ